MEVVSLGWGEEGPVVAGVGVESRDDGDGEPQVGSSDVGPDDEHSEERRQEVTEHVLHWVAVDGGHGHWRSPLVVSLVNVLVQLSPVQQPTSQTVDV